MMQQQPQEQTFPATYNEIAETPYEVRIMETKRGDETVYQPKIVAQGSDYQIYFRTAPLSALYGTHGVDGDESGDQQKFNKTIEQAAVTYTLKKGCSFKKVLKAMPGIIDNQQTTFDILKKQHEQLVEAAFKSDKVKCSGKDKARKLAISKLKKSGVKKPSSSQIDTEALSIYMENSHDSGMKEISWTENGEEVEGDVLKIKRKVKGVRYVNDTDENGKTVRKRTLVSTFPVFHKGTPTGEFYEKKFGDYMPRDTLLILRVRRSFYTTPMMYGSNITFDKDVIVLCEAKKKTKQNASKPIIFFEDEDPIQDTNKRKREDDEESSEAPSPKK
jgi:hypothetical protein